MLGMEYLLPFLLWKLTGRVAPKTLLIAEKCAGSQDMGPLPAHHTSLLSDTGPVLQRSGRGCGGGMRTQAESSFPWRRVGMTSCGVSTSLADLFSQGEVASLWAGSSAKGVYGFLQQAHLLII